MGYRAIAEWSDGWWAVHVEGHAGVWTQARRLEQVAGMAADALSMALEVEVSPADVDVDAVPPVASAAVAVEAKVMAEAAASEASIAMRDAVEDLTAAGMTVRDVGAVLGVSHQRAAVLAREVTDREDRRGLAAKRTARVIPKGARRVTPGLWAASSIDSIPKAAAKRGAKRRSPKR